MRVPLPKARSAVASRIAQLRRKAAKACPMIFARTYLPGHFTMASSSMHEELFALLREATTKRGARLAIAAPRDHAKSTIVSLAYVLWCICYEREPYILLISHTMDQAADLLSQIKRELESNALLLHDFRWVCNPQGTATRWRREEIITSNFIKITALGDDKKFRGRRHGAHRPSLIILDDVESETEVRSADQRRYKEDWFYKTVLKAGTTTTNVILVGTILHYDALLAKLIDQRKSPGWTGHKYQAVRQWATCHELWEEWESIYCYRSEFEGARGPAAAQSFYGQHEAEMLEGTDVLWPQRESYRQLMEMRIREGRASFDSEKQNEPVNPEDCYFQESDFLFWDDEFDDAEVLMRAFGNKARLFGACDPSLGKQGRNADDTAIMTLLKDPDGVLYIIDADIRRLRPDQIIETIIGYHHLRGYQRFAIETNQFQEFLADELARQSARQRLVPVSRINHTSDKLGRIQRMQPLITSGMVRFSRRHVTLLEQLRQFPHAAHDDGPDALEMAIEASRHIEIPRGRHSVIVN